MNIANSNDTNQTVDESDLNVMENPIEQDNEISVETHSDTVETENNMESVTTENELKEVTKNKAFDKVQNLDISNDRLKLLTVDLINFSNLRSLNISNNDLIVLPECINEITTLTQLNFSNNRIKNITLLEKNTHIRVIDGHNNHISSINFDNFLEPYNLIFLDLTDNYISRPTDSTYKYCYSFPSLFFQKSPSFIVEGLYLGSVNSTQDVDYLKGLGIGAVLSIGIKPSQSKDLCNLYIAIEDLPTEDLSPILQTTCNFIEENMKRKRGTLVHCQCGISRSASVVIAYIMKKYDKTYEDALKYVTSKRQCVAPNVGFEKQLKEFQNSEFTLTEKRGWLSSLFKK